jgi:ferredoxin-nitrite reductase
VVGGITGHGDFAADLGVAIAPEQCLPVAIAIVRVFIDEGDRTDRKKARLKYRKKARLKYVLDRMGGERFLAEVAKRLPFLLPKAGEWQPRPPLKRGAHVGFHPQKQPGMVYCGVALPVGRVSVEQMRGLAAIAERFGSGTLRLTVWQNVIVSDIAQAKQDEVEGALSAIGLTAKVSEVRAGLVACTGNTGCKFAASDTKRHALAIADHLDAKLRVDSPLNLHLTGCPHSCAQHYVGDIGLLGAKVGEGEGYHLFVGGGFGERRELAREVLRDIPADEVPLAVERLLRAYLKNGAGESFQAFTRRHSVEALRALAKENADLPAG